MLQCMDDKINLALQYVSKYFDQLYVLYIIQTNDGRLAIYHCDLFSMDPLILGKFDAVWDRGALVAVYPDSDRKM